MPATDNRLTTQEMAQFVAAGYLRFDGLVPDAINQNAVVELQDLYPVKLSNAIKASGKNPRDLKIAQPKEGVVTPESSPVIKMLSTAFRNRRDAQAATSARHYWTARHRPVI